MRLRMLSSLRLRTRTVRQIRGNEVDGTCTYELVHDNRNENRAEVKTLGSSTCR
jgi:hypothetical protein